LANIRAPALGNPKKGEVDKPWAFESKEYARKLLIGRKVRVEIEFSREIPSK
jgi:endonuclease YncB( thermonuclease family)